MGCSPIKAVRELGSERRDRFGPYPARRKRSEEGASPVREDRMDGPLVYLLHHQVHGRVSQSPDGINL